MTDQIEEYPHADRWPWGKSDSCTTDTGPKCPKCGYVEECPFCGAEATTEHPRFIFQAADGDMWNAETRCEGGCGASIIGPACPVPAQAFRASQERWNTRSQEAARETLGVDYAYPQDYPESGQGSPEEVMEWEDYDTPVRVFGAATTFDKWGVMVPAPDGDGNLYHWFDTEAQARAFVREQKGRGGQ